MIKWKNHPEMVEFLMEFIPGHSESQIRKAFEKEFGIELSKGQIKNFKCRFNIHSGTIGGQFEKGMTSWNKGKKMDPRTYEKAKHTMFKKRNIPINHRPVGSERMNVDGYIEIKVAEPNKWRLKHRVMWEEMYHEELTRNDAIIFLDGDHTNFDKDNLCKMTRAELVRYNQDHLYSNDREISRAAASIAKIKTRKKRG